LQERYRQNSWIRRNGALERRRAETSRLDDQVLVHKNPHSPTCLRFHPYNSELIVGERSGVSIWDWEEGSRVHTLTVNQPREARITTLDLVNAHNNALLLTGSDDGSVRIWRNYTSDQCEIASSWKALSDRLPSTRGSGLILQWEQQSSLLFASGDVRHIVVWDVEREHKVQEIATGAESCVTSIATDEAGRSLLIAGCGDGSVRLFDRRSSSGECMLSSHVMTLNEHRSWIVNVFVQTGRDGKIISGSVDGEVRLWDPRFSESVQTISTTAMLSALDLHPNANIFASGSPQNFIKIYNLSGTALSTIRYHDGFMGQRIGPISCLTFHPYKAYLAAGSTDSYLSIYTLEKQKK
jgi:regulator-associated protein of mTOR